MPLLVNKDTFKKKHFVSLAKKLQMLQKTKCLLIPANALQIINGQPHKNFANPQQTSK